MKQVLDMKGGRRRLVLGAGIGIGLNLAGCNYVPKRKVDEVDLCGPDVTPFLVTTAVRQAWARPERYFDAHTHFFNAHDLPVAGFLTKSMGHNVSPWLQQVIATLSPVVEKLSHALAPSAQSELKSLCAAASLRSASLVAREVQLDNDILTHQEQIARELSVALNASPVAQLFVSKAQRISAGRQVNMLGQRVATFDEDFILRAIRRGTAYPELGSRVQGNFAERRMPPLLSEPANADEQDLNEGAGLFAFIGALLSPRHHNLRWFIANYAAGSDKLPLSGCFASMVDFNYWLKFPRTITHMRDQMLVHEQMSLLSGGFMLPVIGYNPWVDIKQQEESIETVKWAVKEHGCVGVKIYPPMGFFPYDNVGNPLSNSSQPRPPDLAELDKRLKMLHETCADLGVPVMAHANESMGRDYQHDVMGGVKGWEAVAKLMAGKKEHRVNLGHFGGSHAHEESDWSSAFAELMRTSKQLKLYADVGHWEDIFKREDDRRRLRGLLALAVDDGPDGATVADRIMYGTDWHMLSKVRDWPRYGDRMLEIFSDFDPSKKSIAKVFGGNVLDCYGLSEGKATANRNRLKAFFEKHTGAAPGWMQTSLKAAA